MKKQITQVVYHETRLELDPTEAEAVIEAGLIALGYIHPKDEVHTINFECGMGQGEGYLETVEVKLRGSQSQGSVGKLDEVVEVTGVGNVKARKEAQ